MTNIAATLHKIDADVMNFYVGPVKIPGSTITLEAEDRGASGLTITAYAGATARIVGRATVLGDYKTWRGMVPIDALMWDFAAQREGDNLSVSLSVPETSLPKVRSL